jgi:hypothetical protein
MLDSRHRFLLQEDYVNEGRVGVALEDKHIIVDFPLLDLLLQHFMQYSLAFFAPHLEYM